MQATFWRFIKTVRKVQDVPRTSFFFLNIHWAKKTFADSFVLQQHQHQQHQLAISMLQHFRPRCRGALQPRIGRNSHRTIWTNIENMPFLFKYEHISARESRQAGLLNNCLNTSVSFSEIFFRIAHWAKEDPGMARRQVYIKKNSLTSILDFIPTDLRLILRRDDQLLRQAG